MGILKQVFSALYEPVVTSLRTKKIEERLKWASSARNFQSPQKQHQVLFGQDAVCAFGSGGGR